MLDYFQGYAYISSLHIVVDVIVKHWPVVFPCNKFAYFFDANVACLWVVVIPADESCPDDFRNIR